MVERLVASLVVTWAAEKVARWVVKRVDATVASSVVWMVVQWDARKAARKVAW